MFYHLTLTRPMLILKVIFLFITGRVLTVVINYLIIFFNLFTNTYTNLNYLTLRTFKSNAEKTDLKTGTDLIGDFPWLEEEFF